MTWQESTLAWCWRSWTQMKQQSRASGCLPSGKVNFHEFSCTTSEDLVCFKLIIVWLNSFWFLQISVGASCLSSPTSSAAFIRACHSASCRTRSPRRRGAVRLVLLTTLIRFPLRLTDPIWLVFDLQFSVAPSWHPFSALTTSNVWNCIRGAWWTTTSSWTWSQRWLACFSSSSSVTSLSRQHSV